MSCPVRAKLFVNQMRRGRLLARSCRHDQFVDGPYRPSGRNAFPSGITRSTIMSPTQAKPGSRTEIRLSARAHTTPVDRAHAPPDPQPSTTENGQTQARLASGIPAQIRSVAAPQLSYVDPGSDLSLSPTERDNRMIVIGTDTHKASHTVAAVDDATGRVLAERTVRAKRRSFEDLLRWARRLGGECVWAIEDCRHVSDEQQKLDEQVEQQTERRTTSSRATCLRPPSWDVQSVAEVRERVAGDDRVDGRQPQDEIVVLAARVRVNAERPRSGSIEVSFAFVCAQPGEVLTLHAAHASRLPPAFGRGWPTARGDEARLELAREFAREPMRRGVALDDVLVAVADD